MLTKRCAPEHQRVHRREYSNAFVAVRRGKESVPVALAQYHSDAKLYRLMRQLSDKLCVEYDLSVIHNPEPGKSRQYDEWKAERNS